MLQPLLVRRRAGEVNRAKYQPTKAVEILYEHWKVAQLRKGPRGGDCAQVLAVRPVRGSNDLGSLGARTISGEGGVSIVSVAVVLPEGILALFKHSV